MIKTHFVVFLYLCFKGLDAIPTGISFPLDYNGDTILAVPAIPRFPGARPSPEATTFLPTKQNHLDDIQKDGRALNNEQQVVPKSTSCRIAYETIYEIEEVETEEEKCNTVFERQCETTFRNKCVPYVDNECEAVLRDQCNTEYQQECQQLFKEEEVPYVEDHCVNTTVKACDKYWKIESPTRKVWVENPDKCQNILKTDCSPVNKIRINRTPYTECIQVPFEKCIQVEENICHDVTREKCEQEPFEECITVPREECKTEHKITPKQIARQIPVRVCDEDYDGSGREDIDNGRDNTITSPQRPTVQPPVRIVNQGQGTETTFLLSGNETLFPSTGVCNSWNGKNCGAEDTVDVGRGHGSCNSNVDCPCCAPFCSKSGYCQITNVLSAPGSCPIAIKPRNCPETIAHTCWSPGVNDLDCPGHGLCCFDGCANTCYNEDIPQLDEPLKAVLDDCSCNEHVSKSGYGKCKKVYGKGPVCYVNQPSTCKDVVESTTGLGKQYSWEACEKLPSPPLYTDIVDDYTLTDEYTDIRQDENGCNCIDYVNKNGVGNCKKGAKRFNNECVCYVSLPSSCPDLKNSNTDAGKFLSAVACTTGEETKYPSNSLLNSLIGPRIGAA